MNKTLKLFSILLMVVVMLSACVPVAFAETTPTISKPTDVIANIKPNLSGSGEATGELMGMAGRILSLIQIASAVAAVVLVAIFGFKFIMGSANEKADYQKSFIPLIVGVVVVFSATSVAKLIFGLLG